MGCDVFVCDQIYHTSSWCFIGDPLSGKALKDVTNSSWYFKRCLTDKHTEKSGFISLSNSNIFLCQQRKAMLVVVWCTSQNKLVVLAIKITPSISG